MEHNNQDLGLVAGAKLKCLLKERGMTQEDFADEFGVDVRTIRRWVKGGMYDLRQLQQIADFLKLTFLLSSLNGRIDFYTSEEQDKSCPVSFLLFCAIIKSQKQRRR